MPESAESLDDLLMGEVSEGASESDEKFSERLKVAQQKLAAVAKDEKKAKNFDQKLAKIIPHVPNWVLDFVVFLINHEIPSLTILAFLALVNEEAGKICYVEFHKYIQERADFSLAKFGDPLVEEKISYWWTFILGADHISTTVQLKTLRNNEPFVRHLSKMLSDLLIHFLQQSDIHDFDKKNLKSVLAKYEKMMFEGL